ncbi:CCR4-NOT transcription complex subunit 10 [Vitis vinifera]|uniref:CCR4-NOT transcription complex subunit 10 n=1 Tax=Vitis vinifera TaxID=29760 RepID=A0A438GPH1_VITVI|nr:CCR4-NOT transcription complex subunit 10 [Vitis vinifera]
MPTLNWDVLVHPFAYCMAWFWNVLRSFKSKICILFLYELIFLNITSVQEIINYLEKAFCVGYTASQGDNVSTAQQQSSNLVVKSSSIPSNSTVPDASNSDSVASLNSSENPLSRTLSEETLDYETMFSALDIDRSIPTVDLKLKLQLYKVRILLLTRNLKAAKREVKQAMNIARGRDSSMALLLKSELEYARGNHRKAIKLLMASMQYLACGKPILAARCFQKASLVFYNSPLLWLRIAECCLMALEKGVLESSGSPSDRSEVRIHVIGKGKWRQLVLENGISRNGHANSVEKGDWLLGDDRQPKLSMSLARQCLLNALHLLDCSASKFAKFGLSSESTLQENESSEVVSAKNSNHKNLAGSDSKASNITVGLGQVNANGDAKEQKGGPSLTILQSSIAVYEDICRRENQMIKQATLANLAYVELELQNPLKALSTAWSLLKLPDCSRIFTFLGHVYAAEALCLLNRPKEASDHLSTYLSGGNNVELPYSEEDREQWRAEKTMDCEEVNGGSLTGKNPSLEDLQGITFLKPEEARGTLYANLATMSAMQGELEQARQFVKQALSIIPNSSEVILTAVYVDLVHGKTQEALAKLKQCSHVRFLASSSQLTCSS